MSNNNNSSNNSSSNNNNSSNHSSSRYNIDSGYDRQQALLEISSRNNAKTTTTCTLWKSLPKQWQRDKEFILAKLENHSTRLPNKSDFERTFPQSLRFDRDIVLAFCRRPDFCLCNKKHDNNTEQSHHGLYYDRHLFVPACLTNDKEVMMAYCAKIPRSLQDCSKELRHDRDVVMTALQHCSGLELQYASPQLQQDLPLLKMACASDGRALMFSPPLSASRQLLVNDREFMLHTVLSSSPSGGGSGSGAMWKVLPPSLKENDEELVLKALSNGLLLRDVPLSYISLDFLKRAIQQNPLLYLELKNIKKTAKSGNSNNNNKGNPYAKWQQQSTLAMEAIVSERSTPQIHALALGPKGCPSLRDNRQVVMVVCQRGSVEVLRDLLGDPQNNNNNNNGDGNNDNINNNANMGGAAADAANANLPPVAAAAAAAQPHQPLLGGLPMGRAGGGGGGGIRIMDLHVPTPAPVHQPSAFADDTEVMKLAISRDPAFFSLASARLQAEPELILSSITPTSAWNTLTTVPWAIQWEHPEITVKAIRLCKHCNFLRYLPTHIPEELWTSHRQIPLTWIQRGGRVLSAFETILRGDADMALQLAKHNWTEFYKVGNRLMSDRRFILQALDMDSRVLCFVPPTLRQDFDVAIVAIANHYKHIPDGAAMNAAPSVSQSLNGIVDLENVKRETKRLLDLHETYVKEFLRGIAIKTPLSAPALLSMLDRGVETSQAFKRLIAEYLGVPVGAKLHLLRKAHDNLQRPDNSRAASSSQYPHAIRRFRLWRRRNNRGVDDGGAAGNGGNGNDDDDDDDDDIMGFRRLRFPGADPLALRPAVGAVGARDARRPPQPFRPAAAAAERRRVSDERLARLEARNVRHRAQEQEESIRRTFPGFRHNNRNDNDNNNGIGDN